MEQRNIKLCYKQFSATVSLNWIWKGEPEAGVPYPCSQSPQGVQELYVVTGSIVSLFEKARTAAELFPLFCSSFVKIGTKHEAEGIFNWVNSTANN